MHVQGGANYEISYLVLSENANLVKFTIKQGDKEIETKTDVA